LKNGRIKKNKEFWKKEVCIIKDPMAIAQNNELKFQRLFEHHPFKKKGAYVEYPLA